MNVFIGYHLSYQWELACYRLPANSSLRTGYTRGSYDHLKEGWQKPCRAGVLSPGKTQLENCPLISL